jgi:suppressor for copper-sensitivity B
MLLFLISGNIAYAHPIHEDPDVKVTLHPMGQFALVSFELEKGAKFYWRNPGELGLATKFDLSGSKNLKDYQIHWPIPELYSRHNVSSYVYKHDTNFIIKLIPHDINKDIEIDANISFSICRHGCHSHNIKLSSITKVDNLEEIPGVILEELNKIPHENGKENFKINKVEQEVIDNQFWLNIEFNSVENLLEPQLFLDLPEYVSFQPSDFNLISSEAGQVLRLPFSINDHQYKKIEDPIFITLVADNGDAIELETVPSFYNNMTENDRFLWVLCCALLGGLLLNVMPCVLPVLALKMLQLVALTKQNNKIIRASLLAQGVGIIFTFISFAFVSYGLQFLGYQTGLGIHFQQPFYLITMVLVLSIIAINLLSNDEIIIRPPQFLVNVFNIKSQQAGVLGFFASGVLSTLLAIPCTAPFVTIAIGFALTTDLLRMVTIFMVMGIGMALPYLIMIIYPNIIRLLPKPGAWMNTFKHILAIAIFATSLWLMYVIATQLGYKAAITLFLLLLLLKFVWSEKQIIIGKTKVVVIAILIFLSYFLPHSLYEEKQRNETLVESSWVEYEPEGIPSLINEGYVVVVNITASWCSTCGLNNITTMENNSVITALNKLKVIAMRGDISKDTSLEIANLMKAKNHFGIPFTLVYSKKYPNGKALPTIITPQILISAIKEAS